MDFYRKYVYVYADFENGEVVLHHFVYIPVSEVERVYIMEHDQRISPKFSDYPDFTLKAFAEHFYKENDFFVEDVLFVVGRYTERFNEHCNDRRMNEEKGSTTEDQFRYNVFAQAINRNPQIRSFYRNDATAETVILADNTLDTKSEIWLPSRVFAALENVLDIGKNDTPLEQLIEQYFSIDGSSKSREYFDFLYSALKFCTPNAIDRCIPSEQRVENVRDAIKQVFVKNFMRLTREEILAVKGDRVITREMIASTKRRRPWLADIEPFAGFVSEPVNASAAADDLPAAAAAADEPKTPSADASNPKKRAASESPGSGTRPAKITNKESSPEGGGSSSMGARGTLRSKPKSELPNGKIVTGKSMGARKAKGKDEEGNGKKRPRSSPEDKRNPKRSKSRANHDEGSEDPDHDEVPKDPNDDEDPDDGDRKRMEEEKHARNLARAIKDSRVREGRGNPARAADDDSPLEQTWDDQGTYSEGIGANDPSQGVHFPPPRPQEAGAANQQDTSSVKTRKESSMEKLTRAQRSFNECYSNTTSLLGPLSSIGQRHIYDRMPMGNDEAVLFDRLDRSFQELYRHLDELYDAMCEALEHIDPNLVFKEEIIVAVDVMKFMLDAILDTVYSIRLLLLTGETLKDGGPDRSAAIKYLNEMAGCIRSLIEEINRDAYRWLAHKINSILEEAQTNPTMDERAGRLSELTADPVQGVIHARTYRDYGVISRQHEIDVPPNPALNIEGGTMRVDIPIRARNLFGERASSGHMPRNITMTPDELSNMLRHEANSREYSDEKRSARERPIRNERLGSLIEDTRMRAKEVNSRLRATRGMNAQFNNSKHRLLVSGDERFATNSLSAGARVVERARAKLNAQRLLNAMCVNDVILRIYAMCIRMIFGQTALFVETMEVIRQSSSSINNGTISVPYATLDSDNIPTTGYDPSVEMNGEMDEATGFVVTRGHTAFGCPVLAVAENISDRDVDPNGDTPTHTPPENISFVPNNGQPQNNPPEDSSDTSDEENPEMNNTMSRG